MQPVWRIVWGGGLSAIWAISAMVVMQRVSDILKNGRYNDLLGGLGDEEGRWVYETFVAKTQTTQGVFTKGAYPEVQPPPQTPREPPLR